MRPILSLVAWNIYMPTMLWYSAYLQCLVKCMVLWVFSIYINCDSWKWSVSDNVWTENRRQSANRYAHFRNMFVSIENHLIKWLQGVKFHNYCNFSYEIKCINFFLYFWHIVSSEREIIYSEVRVFLRRRQTMMSKYQSITTSSNATITLTRNHLIYVKSYLSDRFNAM